MNEQLQEIRNLKEEYRLLSPTRRLAKQGKDIRKKIRELQKLHQPSTGHLSRDN